MRLIKKKKKNVLFRTVVNCPTIPCSRFIVVIRDTLYRDYAAKEPGPGARFRDVVLAEASWNSLDGSSYKYFDPKWPGSKGAADYYCFSANLRNMEHQDQRCRQREFLVPAPSGQEVQYKTIWSSIFLVSSSFLLYIYVKCQTIDFLFCSFLLMRISIQKTY